MESFVPLFQAIVAFSAVLGLFSFSVDLIIRPIKKDIGRLEKDIARVEKDIGRLDKNMSRMEKDISELKEGQKEISLKLSQLIDAKT